MARIPVTDLGGSLNEGKAPSELDPNEFAVLSNFYQFGAKLRRRGGMRRLTSAPFTERITGLTSYRPQVEPPGGVDMIVAGPTRFGLLRGTSVALIPNQTDFTIPTSDRLWTLFQYKNICYGIRDGVSLVRGDGTYVGPGGIDAPTVAATIADGGAGAIPAASFKAVYTFYNANTDMESNPSPVSNTLALAASKKIDWTGLAISTDVQVTGRRIYRTLPDQSGEYFLVDEIENNTQTTYTGDNVLAQDLDRAVSQTNGTPPTGLLFGTVWKERLFASDGVDLFHSNDGLVEAFDPSAFIPVFPDDGHEMRALHAYGDRLVIGKTNKIHYLVGYDPSTFALLTLSDKHGCVSHHSMQSAEGYLFWLGTDNVYRSDGNNVVGIASVKLREILAGMDDEAARDSFAEVYPTLGWYMLTIPGYAQLVYNYRTDVWTTVPTAQDIEAIGSYYDENQSQQLWVADDIGNVYHFHDTDYGYDDTRSSTGFAIEAEFAGRAWGADAGTKHVIEHALLLCPQYAESITLTIRTEGVTVKQRTVSLNYAPRWKLYNLSTRHQAKALSQLHVAYSGATAIELEGYGLDISALNRPTMMAA
jgi:hypothetical protein